MKKNYISSLVLGLNDALMEMMAALIGYTLAVDDMKSIGMIGLITGISASLSMASAEFLSSRYDNDKNPIKSSMYTGGVYLLVVLLLVLPYFLLSDKVLAICILFFLFFSILMVFNIYISKVRKEKIIKNFILMIFISSLVFTISFFVGLLFNKVFNV